MCENAFSYDKSEIYSSENIMWVINRQNEYVHAQIHINKSGINCLIGKSIWPFESCMLTACCNDEMDIEITARDHTDMLVASLKKRKAFLGD